MVVVIGSVCEGALAKSAVKVTPLVTGDITVVAPPLFIYYSPKSIVWFARDSFDSLG